MKKLKILILIASLTFLFHGAFSQEILSQIRQAGKIKVGVSGNQPPYAVEAKDGSLIGFEVELAEQLAKSIGVELELVRIPFAGLLPALMRGEVNLVMSGVTMTGQRNTKVAMKGPYMISGKSILTKSVVLKTVTSPAELNNDWTKLAVLKGTTSEDYVRENTPNAKILTVDNYDAGVKLVRDGTIDALVADYSVCAYNTLVYPGEGMFTLNKPLSLEPIGMALPPNDPLLMNLIDNYLNIMKLNGELDRLQQKWFQSGNWLDQVK